MGEKSGLKVLVSDGTQVGRSGVWTDNVVYPEVLDQRQGTARSRVRGVSRGRRGGRGIGRGRGRTRGSRMR